jgi:hypothetical protein
MSIFDTEQPFEIEQYKYRNADKIAMHASSINVRFGWTLEQLDVR